MVLFWKKITFIDLVLFDTVVLKLCCIIHAQMYAHTSLEQTFHWGGTKNTCATTIWYCSLNHIPHLASNHIPLHCSRKYFSELWGKCISTDCKVLDLVFLQMVLEFLRKGQSNVCLKWHRCGGSSGGKANKLDDLLRFLPAVLLSCCDFIKGL